MPFALLSLGWVLSSSASVWTLLSLVVWINVDNSSLVLESLLSSSDDELLESFLLLDLWGLISNFTVTSQGTVLLSYDYEQWLIALNGVVDLPIILKK